MQDKKGLLDFIGTPLGQGLLATVFGGLAGARRGEPINSLGRAGMSGLAGYGGALDRNAQTGKDAQAQALQKMQMERFTKQYAQEDQVNALAKNYFTPGTPEVQWPRIPGDTNPANSTAATPPRFDSPGYGAALMGVDPIKGAAWMKDLKPAAPAFNQEAGGFAEAPSAQYPQGRIVRPEGFSPKYTAPINVAPGGTLVDPNTNQPIFSSPQKPEPVPSAIQEYQFAKEQGFSGTFEQWDTNRKRAGAPSVSVNTGQKSLDNEMKFSAAFKGEPIYKAHQDVQSAHGQITQALKLGSPAGDLAGATKLMKILDPGSVVRESELAMAMSASGALDRLMNYGNMVITGNKLTPTQRADFQNLADELNNASIEQYNAKRDEYGTFAKGYGLNSDVLLGKPARSRQTGKPKAVFDKLPTASLANKGQRMLDNETNKTFKSNGMQWIEEKQ